MIKFNKTALLISAIVLTGCSLKRYFPDKEKDYQFRTEIAPLIVPKDLSHKTLQRSLIEPEKDLTEKVKVLVEAETVVFTPETENNQPPVAVVSSPTDRVKDKAVIDKTVAKFEKQDLRSINTPPKIDFLTFEGGATRLRISENLAPAWRLVAKALSRNRIEITSRNKAAGQLIVQYDPNKTEFTDKSITDEFFFIFGEDHAQEQEFHIRVLAHNNNIEVFVLDHENKPLSEGAGLKLLKLLYNTIHTELALKNN